MTAFLLSKYYVNANLIGHNFLLSHIVLYFKCQSSGVSLYKTNKYPHQKKSLQTMYYLCAVGTNSKIDRSVFKSISS